MKSCGVLCCCFNLLSKIRKRAKYEKLKDEKNENVCVVDSDSRSINNPEKSEVENYENFKIENAKHKRKCECGGKKYKARVCEKCLEENFEFISCHSKEEVLWKDLNSQNDFHGRPVKYTTVEETSEEPEYEYCQKYPRCRLCPNCCSLVSIFPEKDKETVSKTCKHIKCTACKVYICFVCLRTPINCLFHDRHFREIKRSFWKKNREIVHGVVNWPCSGDFYKEKPNYQARLLCYAHGKDCKEEMCFPYSQTAWVYPMQTRNNMKDWHTKRLRKKFKVHSKKYKFNSKPFQK